MLISFYPSIYSSIYCIKKPLFPKGKRTCWLGLLAKIFCILTVSVVHSTRLVFCVAGDLNPNPWLRSDEGMVSRDPRETAGSQHHGFGKQQHCCYARWIFSCMQDWTVRTRPCITRSNFVSRNSSVWKRLFWKFNSSIPTAELYTCQMLYCVTVMQVTNIFQSLLVAKGNKSSHSRVQITAKIQIQLHLCWTFWNHALATPTDFCQVEAFDL